MRNVFAILAVSLTIVLTTPTQAGEASSCFVPGTSGTCLNPVLQHVEFKAVVTEFVDPKGTGIGHSLSRVLWREVLSSISDVPGAGVILAHDARDEMERLFDGRPYIDYLETEYHDAALQIARLLNVQMSLWGVTIEEQERVFVEPFVTLFSSNDDPWMQFRIANPAFQQFAFSGILGRERLNFAPVTASRADLFERRFATRCALRSGCPQGVPLRAGPSNDDPVVTYVREGSSIHGEDMVEQWVRTKVNGELAYINIYHLHITPPSIYSDTRSSVNLRPSPGANTTLGKVSLAGNYPVMDVGVDKEGRIWYRIDAGHAVGWVAGWLFRPNYLFTVVDFVEGIFRYARLDFNGAVRAFHRFVERGSNESNVTLSTAQQFLAASRLAAASQNGFDRAASHAINDLITAEKLTPYDPSLYALRAAIGFGSPKYVELGAHSLQTALHLDSRNRSARELLDQIGELSKEIGFGGFTGGEFQHRITADIVERLQFIYGTDRPLQ